MRTVDELIASGRRDFLTFWGHRPRPDGSIGPSCLSQWWPAEFALDGIVFATAEHRMMWAKAKLFGDTATAARIVTAATPAEAKKLGREISSYDEEAWQAARFDLVLAANRAKFGQHPALGQYLVDTGDSVLVEAAPNDAVWGIGIAADDPRLPDPAQWPGLNLLGFVLMAVRAELRPQWPDGARAGAGGS